MADTTTTCPHCDEEVVIFICKECSKPAIRNEEEVCADCDKSFCTQCHGDHTCESESEEEEEDGEVDFG